MAGLFISEVGVEGERRSIAPMLPQTGQLRITALQQMVIELDAAGVRPALDPAAVGATFYRRADVKGDGGQV